MSSLTMNLTHNTISIIFNLVFMKIEVLTKRNCFFICKNLKSDDSEFIFSKLENILWNKEYEINFSLISYFYLCIFLLNIYYLFRSNKFYEKIISFYIIINFINPIIIFFEYQFSYIIIIIKTLRLICIYLYYIIDTIYIENFYKYILLTYILPYIIV